MEYARKFRDFQVFEMPSFFTFPLSDISKAIESVARSVRTLSSQQLDAELEELRKVAEQGLATRLMLNIYEQERERRSSPEHDFDAELDMALGRLEQATTPEDRDLVSTIGTNLMRVGGRAAQERARGRMLDLARPSKRDLRASIIEKRWAL